MGQLAPSLLDDGVRLLKIAVLVTVEMCARNEAEEVLAARDALVGRLVAAVPATLDDGLPLAAFENDAVAVVIAEALALVRIGVGRLGRADQVGEDCVVLFFRHCRTRDA